MHPSIETIDCHYTDAEKCSVYLVVEGDRAIFVDNNTALALPHLLAALERRGIPRENVDYAIITHVHLDHAGGTAALLAACPNAKVLAHPKAARHLIAPERLIAGSKVVYGEELFTQLYGEILPCAEDRVITVGDEESVIWNGRRLFFFHTPGHASHHFCIFDEKSNAVFSGDAFGIGRSSRMRPGKPFLVCSTTPTEFDPAAARESIRRIMDTGADTICVGHFGAFDDPALGAEQLNRALLLHEGILYSAADTGLDGPELQAYCVESVTGIMEPFLQWCGVDDVAADLAWLSGDMALNGMGIAAAVQRLRKSEKRTG